METQKSVTQKGGNTEEFFIIGECPLSRPGVIGTPLEAGSSE